MSLQVAWSMIEGNKSAKDVSKTVLCPPKNQNLVLAINAFENIGAGPPASYRGSPDIQLSKPHFDASPANNSEQFFRIYLIQN